MRETVKKVLTGRQIRYLRGLAHHLTPIFQVGKGGVSQTMIEQISLALEARELMKVAVLANSDENADEVAQQLKMGTRAEIVQVIGRTIILYRRSQEKPVIELPR